MKMTSFYNVKISFEFVLLNSAGDIAHEDPVTLRHFNKIMGSISLFLNNCSVPIYLVSIIHTKDRNQQRLTPL